MWKGGFNEGLKKEGRMMRRREERKDYKGKKEEKTFVKESIKKRK